MSVTVALTDGARFQVEPGETVMEAAHRQGIDLAYSCRSGTCRTCLSKVLSGRIEHEAEYEDELMIGRHEIEEGFRLLCSSLAYEDSVVETGW